MGFISVLEFAKKLVEARVKPGDTCIDGTVGGGVDTLFLAKCVGLGGTVYGFDIQSEALERARERLRQAGFETSIRKTANTGEDQNGAGEEWSEAAGRTAPSTGIHMSLASHVRMAELVPAERHGQVAAVMFNLGYLPGGGDPSLVTRPDTSVRALQMALLLLRPGGIATVVIYTGHAGGAEEEAAVRAWAVALQPHDAQVLEYRFPNRRGTAPYLLAILKS